LALRPVRGSFSRLTDASGGGRQPEQSRRSREVGTGSDRPSARLPPPPLRGPPPSQAGEETTETFAVFASYPNSRRFRLSNQCPGLMRRVERGWVQDRAIMGHGQSTPRSPRDLFPAQRRDLGDHHRGVRQRHHGLGYRFRLHRRDLPGTPDLVFPGRRNQTSSLGAASGIGIPIPAVVWRGSAALGEFADRTLTTRRLIRIFQLIQRLASVRSCGRQGRSGG
jgi:hypothetical protein